jgi:hypothetical protein
MNLLEINEHALLLFLVYSQNYKYPSITLVDNSEHDR